ncbi:PAS domain-containing protein [uncultured Ferrovibrio sp.]|jgi:PAS domain S-box-containing protein|uniref:PAS domain-containing protein n=1 Tax=uncultured Ferrovibrio sp. TaxID=1576913 RepID=UPI0026172FBB|nr:PAS domain-containing protein [uncultured Ferrovibrio sp.]
MKRPTPTQVERTFGEDEIIVSKTDTRGRITYANEVFCRVAGYSEHDLVGQPHSIVRHPDMPRCVFQLLWDTISSGNEIFAYVKNMARNGDYYWVFAHVTPSFDISGKIVSYHSSRRKPEPGVIAKVEPLYRALLEEEQRHHDRKQGQAAGVAMLHDILNKNQVSYEQFVFSLVA